MASTTRIYPKPPGLGAYCNWTMTARSPALYRPCVGRQIGVLASHGMRPGAIVPPWIYRAVAYESGDPFRQSVWMCEHDHSRAQDAQLCGADWARSQSMQDAQA
jgi:hypothetical protein